MIKRKSQYPTHQCESLCIHNRTLKTQSPILTSELKNKKEQEKKFMQNSTNMVHLVSSLGDQHFIT